MDNYIDHNSDNDSTEPNMIYLAYDGDNAGRMVGKAVLANDVDALHEASQRINHGHEVVGQWVESHGGSVISGGGDEGVFLLPKDALDEIEQLRKDYQFATELTITVGVGNDLSEAGRALIAGKFRGKDQVVIYDESCDKDIVQAHENIANGSASDEERKISESYLGDDSGEGNGEGKEEGAPEEGAEGNREEANKEENGEEEGEEAKQEGEENAENQEESEGSDEEPESSGEGDEEADEEAAAEESGEEEGEEPKAPPAEGKEDKEKIPAKKEDSEGKKSDKKPSKKPSDKKPEEKKPLKKSEEESDEKDKKDDKKAPKENKDSLEGEGEEEALDQIEEGLDKPGSELAERDLMDDIDDTDLAVGHETQGNASRPTGFSDQEAPGDMGQDQDSVTDAGEASNDSDLDIDEDESGEEGEEDMDPAGVMADGLESGADDAKKEQVFQAVAQALQGFRNQKAILERAAQQAPELYQSTLVMLKAMLEMAKMLGGDPAGQGEEASLAGAPEGEETAEGKEDSKEMPPKKGEEKPAPKAEGEKEEKKSGFPPKKGDDSKKKDLQASVGKLPTKKTTKHVARTTLAPGSVNGKGQQKVIDPSTGKTRWVDRKKGSVKSSTGVPIRAPKPGES